MAIASALGTRNADNSLSIVTPSRTGPYGEAFVLPLGGSKNAAYAEEGSYFSAQTATNGAPTAATLGHAVVQTSISTKPFILIYNSSANKSITLDFARFRCAVVHLNATDVHIATWVDNNGASAYTSGGGAITVNNCNPGRSNAFAGTLYAGAVVAAAGTGEVNIDRESCRSTVIDLVQDQYNIQFGGAVQGVPCPNPVQYSTSSAAILYTAQLAPMVIPPLGNGKIVIWATAGDTTGPQYEFQIGMWQR